MQLPRHVHSLGLHHLSNAIIIEIPPGRVQQSVISPGHDFHARSEAHANRVSEYICLANIFQPFSLLFTLLHALLPNPARDLTVGE